MNTTLRRRMMLGIAGAVATVVFLAWPRDLHQAGPRTESSAVPAPVPVREEARNSPRERASSRMPASRRDGGAADSLQGTEIAGGLLVDADGNFVPGPETVALFEYFLSLTGEKSREQILAAIQEEIRKRLGPPAQAQALAFLDRYMLYRERGLALGLSDVGDEDLRSRFDKLRALRREIFGDELAQRLFGDEEAETEIAVRQREIAADPDRSDEEKAAEIEKLYDDLPPAAREARDEALAAVRLREDEEKIRASGGGDAEIRALRVERFGEEAADRLGDLDHERSEWDSRFSDYRSERARILADRSMADAQRQAALERLLEERFDKNERVRAKALDELQDEQGGVAK